MGGMDTRGVVVGVVGHIGCGHLSRYRPPTTAVHVFCSTTKGGMQYDLLRLYFVHIVLLKLVPEVPGRDVYEYVGLRKVPALSCNMKKSFFMVQ